MLALVVSIFGLVVLETVFMYYLLYFDIKYKLKNKIYLL